MKISVYGNTNVGKQRDHNEDSFLIVYETDGKWIELTDFDADLSLSKGVVCVVADGMGGTNAGEVASAIAVDTVRETISKLSSVPSAAPEMQKLLNSIIIDAHNNIVKSSRQVADTQGMGTTIVLGFFIKNTLYVAWSGDSRCYVYNKKSGKELYPFTDDHSLVWERVMSQEIDPEEARLSDESNLILQSLGGAGQKPRPDFRWVRLNNNDRVVFCSDGLNSMLSNIGIQQILDFNSSPNETAESLIQAANNAGGRDNITMIVIDISEMTDEPVKSEGYKEVTVSDIPKRTNRKRPYFLLFIIILILLAASGIVFRNEISTLFRTFFEVRSGSGEINLTDEIDTVDTDIGRTIILPEPETTDPFADSRQETIISPADSIAVNMIDTTLIESHLRATLDIITDIRKKIGWSKPGGEIHFTPDYYEKVKPIFDSILIVVDRQEELIRNVATLTVGGRLDRVSNYPAADKIFKEIRDTINILKRRRENVGETYIDPEK